MVSQTQATIIAALVGLIGGFVAAEISRRQKADELFFQALNFLGGKTQVRNLGIAAIELYWKQRRHREVSALLLVGVAIYLLAESDQTTEEHEKYNLERIVALLLSDTRPSARRAAQYAKLRDILRRPPPQLAAPVKGVQIDQNQRNTWAIALDRLARTR